LLVLVLSGWPATISHFSAAKSLVEQLTRFDPTVGPAEGREALANMLNASIRARRGQLNDHHTRAWEQVQTREDWEAFRKPRLDALASSLGATWPPFRPGPVAVRVTGTIDGAGFAIENLVFESRPGLWVTANLYRPATARPLARMPGILICHAHHT